MIRTSADDLARWRAEIDLGVEFRDREFGTYRQSQGQHPPQTTGAGENLDLYEQGASNPNTSPLLNLVFPIVKGIVPTLLYQYPKASALPATKQEGADDDAFYVSELLNRDLRDPDTKFKAIGKDVVFDSFVLGFGVAKVGYSTTFGQDILPTEAEQKLKLRTKMAHAMKQLVSSVLGTPPPAPIETPQSTEQDASIRAERPYLQWVSPFDFVIDPRARNLEEARWVAQRIRKTLAAVKADRRYGAAKHELVADALDDERVDESFIEEFQAVDVWEVHYQDPGSPTGITVLTFAATQDQTKTLMHDHNVYDLGGWQYEWLAPNKHGHRLYPVSVLSVMRPLLDRISTTLDALLDQIDKFQAKIAYNERVSPEGETALDSPILGSRVKILGNEDVRSAIAVISMQQVAADLMGFVNQLVDLLLVVVGMTRAQFTGISSAQTATEAQIGQGGQNLRRSDEANTVGDFLNRLITKYWMVKAQFQDLTEQSLPQEAMLLNPQTQMSQTQWFPPIDQTRAERLRTQRFEIGIELGSAQKPNMEVLRAQLVDAVRMLMEPQVTQGLAIEGKRLSASEIIRQIWRTFEEYGLTNVSKMVVPVTDPAQQSALLNYGQKPSPANGNGGRMNGAVPTYADQVSAAAGEKGMGIATT